MYTTILNQSHSATGLSENEELHQYVLYDTIKEPSKGPRRIVLDDGDKNKNKHKYTPPNSITIHLSKISMPELQPKVAPSDKPGKEAKPGKEPKKKDERKGRFLHRS